MDFLKIATLAIIIGLCPLGAHALEATAHNTQLTENIGLVQRMEAGFATLTAAINELTSRIAALETRVTALENRPAGSLRYMGSATAADGASSARQNYDICVLARVRFSTVEDNHGHTCLVERDGNGFRLRSERSSGSRTSCAMHCYNVQ